jgi:hypothetical protein
MMMLRKIPVLLLPLVVLSPSTSYGGPDGPSNYDECIVDALKGVSSDVAARAIIESCGNLFPDPDGKAATPMAPAPAADDTVTPAAPAAALPAAQSAAPVDPAPLDTSGARALTPDELGRLSTKAKIFGSTYRITVNNDNPGLTLTDVTIAVWDDSDPAVGRKEYSKAVQIGPQASAEVKYIVHYRGDESGWRWALVAASGVE